MEELKACPFCGGEAEYKENDCPNVYFECLNCETSFTFRGICADFAAIKAWNTRTK